MQNKLNEILELCVEKSGENRFYEFRYNVNLKSVIVYKYISGEFKGSIRSTISEVLKYMQNE